METVDVVEDDRENQDDDEGRGHRIQPVRQALRWFWVGRSSMVGKYRAPAAREFDRGATGR